MSDKEQNLVNKSSKAGPERLYRVKTVLSLIPISRSSWFDGIKQGKYPKGHLLSERTRVWKESEIQAIIDNLG